ncbi:hypothetical protein [Butyrivibrio sp. INlla16]|uniref:hypothetical protein n=1 Tax=Butyrivibrio sp. INlla16 TaxID=1520807 RepID=UPI00089102BF|nr:hypothetical protein [Butyrivibrio sp. INlla16]SDB18876.1 hypothetical protein SAMN02910263_00885 [Butyrivibrio sp. INlla16]
MPGYVRQGKYKTAILTNQICRIKDDSYIRFPGTTDTLKPGRDLPRGKLKEVRIKPHGKDFVMDVVINVLTVGIEPLDDKDVLRSLSSKDDISDIRVMSIDPGTDNIAAVANNFGAEPFVIKGGLIKSVNQFYNKEMGRLSSCA